jgi:hypothetical protein
VHEGGFGLTRTDDGLFIFTRPNGTPIEASGCTGAGFGAGGSIEPRFRGNAPANASAKGDDAAVARTLERLHAELGLAIDSSTCCSLWGGERMDYGWAVADLIRLRNLARGYAH